ncbi:MAG: cag pathogenicity island protein [Lachnospiraceae bacterium]|nr:cag pathogenicity island protein [Lachnospiraceae bacterium]
MGSKYTEAQKRATANYMKDKHTIRVVVTKEEADRYKKAAEKRGYPSLNKFIIDCIKKEML